MKLAVNEREDRLTVNVLFPDSRVVDLDVALHEAAGSAGWTLLRLSQGIDHLEYAISDRSAFLAGVRFTHGLEPPTRVLFENRDPASHRFQQDGKRPLIAVVKAFLEECANRGLVSPAREANALAELNRHDKVEV